MDSKSQVQLPCWRAGEYAYLSSTSAVSTGLVSRTKPRTRCEDSKLELNTIQTSTMTFPLLWSISMRTKLRPVKPHPIRYVTYVTTINKYRDIDSRVTRSCSTIKPKAEQTSHIGGVHNRSRSRPDLLVICPHSGTPQFKILRRR